MQPNTTENQAGQAPGQVAAFQRLLMETLSKMGQAALTVSPTLPPAEALRQLRGGMFQALGDSCEGFMRSPEFLEGSRQFMENTIVFRKFTNDLMARARTELQAPSRGDIDSIMLTVRHMEKRLLDRLDELSTQVAALGSPNQPSSRAKKRPRARASRGAPVRKPSTPNGNVVTV